MSKARQREYRFQVCRRFDAMFNESLTNNALFIISEFAGGLFTLFIFFILNLSYQNMKYEFEPYK